MQLHTVSQNDLDSFLVRVNEHVSQDWNCSHRSAPVITAQVGNKYAKLVADDRSAFGFVDLTNGNVLYAASWKAPAKNFARGNINDAKGGVGRVKWTGVF